MPGFRNPITGGQGALVRPAIKSPNYVAATIGWTINKDGTAEFNNVTVRGSVFVVGANGTIVQITNTPTVALILLRPPTVAGVTWDSAQIVAAEDATADHRPALVLTSPDVNLGGTQSTSEVWVRGSGVTTADSEINLRAGRIVLDDNKFSARTDLVMNTVSQGQGLQFATSSAGNVTVGVEATVLGAATNFVFRAGRCYEIVLRGRMGTNTAGNLAIFKLKKGTTAASPTYIDFGGMKMGAIGDLLPVTLSAYLSNSTGADITQSVQGSLAASAGTVTWDGGTIPRSLIIRDIGAASGYAGAANSA